MTDGGILLGYRREGHMHITAATVPQSSDYRRRFWFSRSSKYHQQVALRHWEASVGAMDYLGEWHTHPENNPSPSSLDFSEWRKIYLARPNPMMFMILGWSGEVWVEEKRGPLTGFERTVRISDKHYSNMTDIIEK